MEHLANCEECGTPIPVEDSHCDKCKSGNFDTCHEAGNTVRRDEEE